MSRWAPVLLLLLSAGPANAVMPEREVARALSFGGSCGGCEFDGQKLSGVTFAGARLRQSNLNLATMNRTNFSGADLRDVDGFGGVFSSANFANADLSNSTWVGAFLEGSNFRGAKLSGANFSGAEMARSTGLTQGQLNAACGDQATTLPAGMSIPACR